MDKIIIGGIIGIVVGAGATFALTKNSGSDVKSSKEYQDAVTMMKDQSASIREMGGMMKTAGTMMQDGGAKYKDDALTQQGKDLSAVADKNLQANQSGSAAGGMQQMMQ